MDYTLLGPAISLGLGCIGSSIGCGIAGMASHAVMARVEEGHGKILLECLLFQQVSPFTGLS